MNIRGSNNHDIPATAGFFRTRNVQVPHGAEIVVILGIFCQLLIPTYERSTWP